MYQTDMQSNLATAEDRGERRGERKSRIEIARNALQMKMSVADIAKLTGLSHDEIESVISSTDFSMISWSLLSSTYTTWMASDSSSLSSSCRKEKELTYCVRSGNTV